MRINLLLILFFSWLIVSVSSFTTAAIHASTRQHENIFNDETNNKKKSHLPPLLLSHLSKTKIILKHAKKLIHRTKNLQVTKRISSSLLFAVIVSQRATTTAHAVDSLESVEPATNVLVTQPTDAENAMITNTNVETKLISSSSKRTTLKLMSGVVAGIGLGGALSKKKKGLDDDDNEAGKNQFEKLMGIVRKNDGSSSKTTTTTSEDVDNHSPSPKKTTMPSDLARQKKKIRENEIAVARRQPKSPREETTLKEKYAKLPLEERAFQILYDLGMIELTPDPDDSDYDDSLDDELAPENVFPPND